MSEGGQVDRFAEVRRLENAAVDKMMAARRAPWRLLRNERLLREALKMLADARAELGRVRWPDEPPGPEFREPAVRAEWWPHRWRP